MPGYRLLRRLGSGGFGEVWQAEAPGGFPIALKFVRFPEDLQGEPAAGAVELRALDIIKGIRHPNLIVVFGAWKLPGLLTIAMELADGSLWDRLRETSSRERPGIPAAELLEYMREAAKGIDFLNEPRHKLTGEARVSVQHRDIKPHNILLVGTGIKIADFGLAKILEKTVTSNTGALTPAYAAPEFFKGQTHSQSDQYCLAVTYCQLRGSRLPFNGNVSQVIAGHLMEPPDLSMLPAEERSAVARALAKKPQERWLNCREFVNALSATGPSAPLPPADGVQRPDRPVQSDQSLVPPTVDSVPSQSEVSTQTAEARTLTAPTSRSAAASRQSTTLATPKPGRSSAGPVLITLFALIAGISVAIYTGWLRIPLPFGTRGTSTDALAHQAIVPVPIEPRTFRGHTGAVRCVALSADRSRVVSGGSDGTVRLWETATGQPLHSLKCPFPVVWSVACSADGHLLVAGGGEWDNMLSPVHCDVCVWDGLTGKQLHRLQAHQDIVTCVHISSDGTRILSASADGMLCHWNAGSGQDLLCLPGNRQRANPLSISDDGRFLLSAGDGGADQLDRVDYPLHVWDPLSGKQIRRLEGTTQPITAAAFAPDGNQAASSSFDGTVRLWEVALGKELHKMVKPLGLVHALAYSGKVVVAGTGNVSPLADNAGCGTWAWDVANGKEIEAQASPGGAVLAVAISADGKLLLTGCEDGLVRSLILP